MAVTRKHLSGGQATAAERQARHRDRLRARGLKPATVIIPDGREDELKQIAAQMRREHEMEKEIKMIALKARLQGDRSRQA